MEITIYRIFLPFMSQTIPKRQIMHPSFAIAVCTFISELKLWQCTAALGLALLLSLTLILEHGMSMQTRRQNEAL